MLAAVGGAAEWVTLVNLTPLNQGRANRNNFLSGLKVRDEGARTC